MFQLKSVLIVATLGLLALADPYKTLGVSKQALPQRIVSAFKRKAIDYHPSKLENEIVFNDVLLKQNQEKFNDAAAAYSEIRYGYKLDTTTLNSDNYEQFYYKFFQNGQVCGLTGPNQYECEASTKPSGYYSAYKKTKCIDLNIQTLGQFLDRKEAWLIHNYQSVEKMEKDTYMVKAFSGAADLMQDKLFQVGVTDCQYESEICDYFDDSDSSLKAWAYPVKGERKSMTGYVTSAETYKTFAMNTFQNFTIDEMYEQTVPRTVRKAKAEDKKIAILFTENNTTPKVWTIIGQYFEPWFIFATSNKKNTKMVEKFGVKTFPTVVIIDDPTNVGNALYYTGEVEKEGIVQHLKQFRKPEILEFQKLTKELFDSDKLCQRSDGKFCFIYIIQNDESLINAVAELPKIYKKKPLRFLYVQEGFGEQLDNKPGFAIIKSKRGRYVFEQAQNIKVEDFIDQALDGSLNYVPMPDDVFESIKYY